jgi:P4 family phage/plasmid primase-like protien
MGSAKTIAAIERLARADRGHAMPAEAFDKYPMMLNTPSGVLDLISGRQLERNKLFYMTKSTGGGLGDQCPLWLKFIDRVTGNDRELADFLQRFSGYCLTGDTSSHALLFLFGLGANGKSTFANALVGMLGDYATVAPSEMFVESFTARHPTELARLRAARLVVVQEVEDGQRWATAKIKQLTGGDRVTAHFMRQDFFEYTPQFKLLFCGNHKPSLRTVDEAIRRRFYLVPFTVTIPPGERDPDLLAKLRGEWGGILRWALEGCLAWRKIGLAPPEAVRNATDLYMGDEDLIGGWMNECCEQEARAFVPVSDLHKSYQAWAERAGEKFFGQKRFSQVIEDHGYERARDSSSRIRGFRGLRLRRAQERLEGVA